MNPQKKKVPNVVRPLPDWLNDKLGDSACCPIDVKLGEYIEALATECPLQCHVQWTQHNGLKLKKPILWRYSFWKADSESYLKAKERSERERKAKFVFDKNVENLVFAITDQTPTDEGWARSMAIVIVSKMNHGKAAFFGVKLIQNYEDL